MPAATQLYIEANGRITCAELRCAGMTAHFSGMKTDLHGATIDKMTPEWAKAFEDAYGAPPSCESCDAPQSLLVTA